jgi:hypothetical protein
MLVFAVVNSVLETLILVLQQFCCLFGCNGSFEEYPVVSFDGLDISDGYSSKFLVEMLALNCE